MFATSGLSGGLLWEYLRYCFYLGWKQTFLKKCMHASQRMANNLWNQLSNMCLIIYYQHDSLSCACKVCLIYLLKYKADKLLLCVKLLCKTVIIHIMHLQFHLP